MGEWESNDGLWRTLALWALGLAAAGFAVGGWFGRISGRWQLSDGGQWQLRQLGPWVLGSAAVPGGRQAFVGVACFGHAWLSRRDFGAGHLQALGFAPEQVGQVQGQVTGTFRLRRRGPHAWAGHFIGRSFHFAQDGQVSARNVAPQPRRLERLGEAG